MKLQLRFLPVVALFFLAVFLSPSIFGQGADLRWLIPLLLVTAVISFLRGREKITKRYYNPDTGYEVVYNQIRRKKRKFKKPLKAA